MAKFVTDEQFSRARNIVRRISYRKTIDGAEPGKYGSQGVPDISIEGRTTLTINFDQFYLTSDELAKIQEMDEISERDSVVASEHGLEIVLHPNPQEEDTSE